VSYALFHRKTSITLYLCTPSRCLSGRVITQLSTLKLLPKAPACPNVPTLPRRRRTAFAWQTNPALCHPELPDRRKHGLQGVGPEVNTVAAGGWKIRMRGPTWPFQFGLPRNIKLPEAKTRKQKTIRKRIDPAFIEPMRCKPVTGLPAGEKWVL
jgi:hypothetical protein